MNYSVNFIIGKYYIDTVDMTIRKSSDSFFLPHFTLVAKRAWSDSDLQG